MTTRLILCQICRHHRPGRDTSLTCDAFPERIPQAILEWEADHRQPYEGDGGIRFELRDDLPPEIRAWELKWLREAHAQPKEEGTV